jgi:hypothetical protein
LKVPDTLAGKVANCPKCKSAMTVPTPVEEPGFTVVDDPPVVAPKREPARPQPAAPLPQAMPAMAQPLVTAPAFADPTPPAPLPPEPPVDLPVAQPAERSVPAIDEPAARPKSVKPKPPLTMRIGDIGPRTRPDREGKRPNTDQAETRLETRRGPADETATARPAMALPVSARGPRKPDLHPAVFYGILALGLLFAAGWGFAAYLVATEAQPSSQLSVKVTYPTVSTRPTTSGVVPVNPATPPVSTLPDSWTTYTPPVGGFRVKFPGPGEVVPVAAKAVAAGDGRVCVPTIFQCQSSGAGGNLTCKVTAITFPTGIPQAAANRHLDQYVKEVVGAAGGNAVNRNSRPFGSTLGWETVVRSGGGATTVFGWVVKGNVGYVLSIRGPADRPSPTDGSFRPSETDGFLKCLETEVAVAATAPKPNPPTYLTTKPMPPAGKTPPAGWETFTSLDGVFRVAVPSAPRVDVNSIAVLQEFRARGEIGRASGSGGLFTAGYLRFTDAASVPTVDELHKKLFAIGSPKDATPQITPTAVTVDGKTWSELRSPAVNKSRSQRVQRILVSGSTVYFQIASHIGSPAALEAEKKFLAAYEILTPDS